MTMEESLLEVIERTKGDRSTSDRVNELLKLALEHEKRVELDREAAIFFGAKNRKDRSERRAFQKAALRSFAKE